MYVSDCVHVCVYTCMCVFMRAYNCLNMCVDATDSGLLAQEQWSYGGERLHGKKNQSAIRVEGTRLGKVV